MADLRPDRGLFLSVLEAIDRPGQVVRNLAAGRTGGALRQVGQFGLDAVDALLPGDWLPNDLAKEEDYVSGRDLLGGGDDIGSKVAGFGVDVLTDPLTYIPGAVALKGLRGAGKLATKGAEKVIGEEAVGAAGRHLRKTFNQQRLAPGMKETIGTARATQAGVAGAQVKSLDEILKGTTEEQQQVLGEAFLNIKRDTAGKAAGLIDPTEQADLATRAAQHFAGRPDAEQLAKVVDDLRGFSKRQFESGRDELGIFAPGQGVQEYFPRQFSGIKTGETAAEGELFGRPSPVRGRTLEKDSDVLKFLQESPDVSLEFNVQRALGKRAEQHGLLAGRGKLGQDIVGPNFQYANPEHRAAFEASLKQMDPETAQVVGDLYHGLPARGAFTNLLAKSNAIFKPNATAGYVIPKIGFNTRNRLSGIWQTYSNPETRGQTLGMAKRFFSDTAGAIGDAMGLATRDELGKGINAWDDALRTSGGSYAKALDTMRTADPVGAELIKHGVMDGFVRSEEMLSAAKGAGLFNKLHQKAKWPAKITRGIEDRMRFGLGRDLVAKFAAEGLSLEEAAQKAAGLVKDTLFDFSVSSTSNRAFRDIVPFGNYMAQAIPQQAKFLASTPPVAVGLAELLRPEQDEPLYPYMEGKANIPIGTDEQGNRQYISGLGLPFEALGSIPNPSSDIGQFGRQIQKNVLGATQPLLKSVLAAITGEDPYFETPYGSYSKLPGNVEGGAFGRAYNQAAGTGLIQPLASVAGTAGKIADDRRSAGTKALDLLTGANVVSVDPDVALRQQLQAVLNRNPSIAQIKTPVNVGKDPEVAELLAALRETKKRIKDKKSANVAP